MKILARFRKAKKVVTAPLQIIQWTVAGYKRSSPGRAGRMVSTRQNDLQSQVSVSTGSTQVWRITQEREPVVGTQIDTGDFIGAFALAWPSLEFVHVEP